jgi:hypothetical protein
MGCGCKCGHCPNAFDSSQLGAGEFTSPVSAMYEIGEFEEERGRRGPSARRTTPARPQSRPRMTASKAPPRRPAGHVSQARRASMAQPSHAHRRRPGTQAHPRQSASQAQGRRLGGMAHPRQPAGPDGGPGAGRGIRGAGWPRVPIAPVGGAVYGPGPNAVILNRRFADQLGWRASFDQMVTLLGPAALGGESAFVQAVAQWQATKGLTPNGVLGAESWNQMQEDLGASPDAAPLDSPPTGSAPPPAPLPQGADAPPDEMEWEFEPAPTLVRPASRRWAHCPPSADTPPTERTVLAVTSRLGTGKPFACTVSAEDGISMGLIRWNLRNGTLQQLLARFENRTGRLIHFFGADYDRLMGLIAMRRSAAQRGRAVAAASAERLADRWRGPLLSLFAEPTFYSMLMHDVRGRLAAAKGAARRLGLWTVRGLALIFDITAHEGLGPAKIKRFAARLRQLESARGPLSEQEKLVAIAEESVQRLTRHRDEWRARRMVIATGSGPARGRWWDLGRDYANLDAPWES